MTETTYTVYVTGKYSEVLKNGGDTHEIIKLHCLTVSDWHVQWCP